MLFDETVTAFVKAHFVPVITDHPAGRATTKRNPKTWEQSESWKRYPSSSELVWLVSADLSRRAGVVYSKLEQPSQLLAWMEAVLVFDGQIENPTPEQVQQAVLVQMRSDLHRLWRWRDQGEPEREFHQRQRAFDKVADAVTDDQLCELTDAPAMLARLRQPPADRSDQSRATLEGQLAAARDGGLDKVEWLPQFTAWFDAGQLGDGDAHELAVLMLRSWLGRELEAGSLRAGAELRATLEKLGVPSAGTVRADK